MEATEPANGTNLQGQLLIAMPGLTGGCFSHSVVYICQHSPDGAMGLIVNQPLEISLGQVLGQLDLPCPEKLGAQPLLLGGPVQRHRGFILHRNTDKQWLSSVPVNDEVCLTISPDIIESIANDQGPSESLIVIGYAGWSSGQLEQELLDNAWLTTPTDTEFLFEIPFEKRARIAAARIGVDLEQLSNSAGHA